MSIEIEIVKARLKEMQDLIEVASLYQRKLQITDDSLVAKTVRADGISAVLDTIGE